MDGGFFFTSARNYTRIITQTYTETMQRLVTETYSAQMQMLDIVNATGGLDKFNDSMNTLMTSFYSEEEQLAFLNKSMKVSFDALNVTMPKSREEYRKLLEGMNTSTKAGAELYGHILSLAEAFDQLMTKSEELKDTYLNYDGVLAIIEAWNSELSYLNSPQKTAFTDSAMKLIPNQDDSQSAIEVARLSAEAALKSTETREDYIRYFDRYIEALEDAPETATLDDVVEELRVLIDRVENVENTLIRT
jgi:hypothetical protein